MSVSTFTGATHYMSGTRRVEEMIADARSLSFTEQYSYTEGWDDNTVVECMNLGLDRLYDALTQIDSPANIQEYVATTYAGQQLYDIPIDVKLAININDVRYLYGPEVWQFITLRQGMIQDRFGYPTNIPDTYAIRDGQLILSPTPNVTRQNSLIVNYQKRMRKLDIRRGKVSSLSTANGQIASYTQTNPVQINTTAPHGLSTGNRVGNTGDFLPPQINENTFIITVTGASSFTLNGVDGTLFPAFIGPAYWFLTPMQFLLNFTVTSQKDINLQANANSLLDKIDWSCFCDRNGNPIIDAIPLTSYNQTTLILTADQNYVPPADNWIAFSSVLANGDTIYVLAGDYSSSHSQLDRQTEDHLIEYTVLRLLRLQSAAEPTTVQLAAEDAVLQRLRLAYRRYRPSVVPIVWQERLRPRSWPWGRRGMYSHIPLLFTAFELAKHLGGFNFI